MLERVIISEGVAAIGNQVFMNNTAITSVTIPEGVTTIGNQVFQGCTALTTVTLPVSVISIGDNAFQNLSHTDMTFNTAQGSYAEGYVRILLGHYSSLGFTITPGTRLLTAYAGTGLEMVIPDVVRQINSMNNQNAATA